MVQGTSSSAGKSLLVTALCRIYARAGIRVAPFKAQNMSNNAGVCADGSEIGRSQITQALAAGIAPRVAMNPILLKPEAGMRSQVVIMGRPYDTVPAGGVAQGRELMWNVVTAALDQLRDEFDLVIVEGAGSPVELNLMHNDIVNMAVARYAQADVLLVGDIDRGGVFAQLLGTLWLMPADDQALVRGLVVNKFRGDIALFEDGRQILEERSGKPVLGVIPWMDGLQLPEEDAVALDHPSPQEPSTMGRHDVDIAVIQFPTIANFDDFDPLRREPGVRLRFVQDATKLGRPQAVVLPGTKSTMADLAWLRRHGLAERIVQLVGTGAHVVGICGGYQMLGTEIHDPQRVEGSQGHMSGLNLLPLRTTFSGDKATYQASARITAHGGWLTPLAGHEVYGYEIHMGSTESASPWLTIERRGATTVQVADGAMSQDQRIWGCYLHGLFANDAFRRAWLRHLGQTAGAGRETNDSLAASFDRLADVVQHAMNLDALGNPKP